MAIYESELDSLRTIQAARFLALQELSRLAEAELLGLLVDSLNRAPDVLGNALCWLVCVALAQLLDLALSPWPAVPARYAMAKAFISSS